MRRQTSVDNTVNDLHYEIKFEICVKDKKNFFIKRNIPFFAEQRYILLSETYFFQIPENLITSANFLLRQVLKNINMPRQKPRMLHW